MLFCFVSLADGTYLTHTESQRVSVGQVGEPFMVDLGSLSPVATQSDSEAECNLINP